MGEGHFREFEEEYLETLYEFFEKDPEMAVRTGELAKSLGVSPASVTEMVQRLAKNGFLNYEKYKGATLTPLGLEKGRKMKRRHRIIEAFLVEVLRFQGDVHETACVLEHAVSDDLEATFDKILGSPDKNPYGKPIPPPIEMARQTVNHNDLLFSAASFESGNVGVVEALLLSPPEGPSLSLLGISIGAEMTKIDDENWLVGGAEVQISISLGKQILLRRSSLNE